MKFFFAQARGAAPRKQEAIDRALMGAQHFVRGAYGQPQALGAEHAATIPAERLRELQNLVPRTVPLHAD